MTLQKPEVLGCALLNAFPDSFLLRTVQHPQKTRLCSPAPHTPEPAEPQVQVRDAAVLGAGHTLGAPKTVPQAALESWVSMEPFVQTTSKTGSQWRVFPSSMHSEIPAGPSLSHGVGSWLEWQ